MKRPDQSNVNELPNLQRSYLANDVLRARICDLKEPIRFGGEE
jgi:hypothetical protein